MADPRQQLLQLGPEARVQAELLKLESQTRHFWVLLVFAIMVLAFGAVSLLTPQSFWQQNKLEISFSPQALFVVLVALVVIAFQMFRREREIQKLRLTNLQQTLEAKSEQAASKIDPATNVFGRGFLHELLQGEISRADRTNRALSLMMCDLNNFKQVNDRYGHLMGDYVLAQMAEIFKSCVRGSDHVVRYGGDEFLLLLPETDQIGGEIVRKRIYTKVADWDRANRVGDLPVSVSVGLYLHVPGQTAERDVAEADALMYTEKQAMKSKAAVAAGAASQR